MSAESTPVAERHVRDGDDRYVVTIWERGDGPGYAITLNWETEDLDHDAGEFTPVTYYLDGALADTLPEAIDRANQMCGDAALPAEIIEGLTRHPFSIAGTALRDEAPPRDPTTLSEELFT